MSINNLERRTMYVIGEYAHTSQTKHELILANIPPKGCFRGKWHKWTKRRTILNSRLTSNMAVGVIDPEKIGWDVLELWSIMIGTLGIRSLFALKWCWLVSINLRPHTLLNAVYHWEENALPWPPPNGRFIGWLEWFWLRSRIVCLDDKLDK